MTSQRTRDRLVQRLRDKGIQNEMVLDVMRSMPRHLFVDEALAQRAYEDDALPIGHGQTISQPFIVARMTEILLSRGVPDKVLEVGTGSGFQAAVLSRLVSQVYSVERIVALQIQARELFHKLNFNNIALKHTDGSWGWPQNGPYPAIIVTAAPEQVPDALLDQLAVGGIMIIPVGGQAGGQKLLQITRGVDGYTEEELDGVYFVPLLKGAVRQ
ncbi:MAG: protein-L-isoaspartate(D-aspartate) O-methyltransferase [Gammaproteobacteria bacterium]|nr:protein-L-isoaspartate(D-aspartate) O-methyltransferase [Gammaproteobacteria bacterium]MCW8909878.1 protein-L-isoaspartate(D-aspartate) O-methyltransferase [Gammaproteobacteria bacterium]MCW9005092.1 protein-L-isoaspartate(D-aspartate) O-methyltransferase [Gammaproteobacteria bacterium]MCW9055610.1 protein-L-isoaspartate(D-aspartate) O-methyltransferase [Gammaproteobacteria bacterium]